MNSPKGWDGFVEALKEQWENNSVTSELTRLTGDNDLSIVLWGCLHRQAVEWLYREIPIIDNKRPIDLLADKAGKNKIMQLLISNPWW